MPVVVTSVTTRTTTTNAPSSVIIWNYGYSKTTPGLLKIAEIIVAAIILVMLLILLDDSKDLTFVASPRHHHLLLFQYVVVTFFIGSFLLLLGCLVSLSTGSIIAKTSYEFIYHGGAFILYAIATLWVVIVIKDYRFDTYKLYFYSAALGVVNTILYLISCVVAHRSYRWT